jgi:hypothetical protein
MKTETIAPTADIEIENCGSLFLFRPNSEAAREHLEAHCGEATWFGGALVCEHRYAEDLAAALRDDGFAVE